MTGSRLLGVLIILLVIASLIPFYLAYEWIERKIKPRYSISRFFLWLLAELILVGLYTFLVVFLLKMIFPLA